MSYRGKYYDERQPRRNIAGMIGWGFVGVVCVVVLFGLGWLVLGDLQEQRATNSTLPQAAATQAPAIVLPTQRPYVQQMPVIVQSVPTGQAPQPVTIPAPVVAPVVDSVIEQPQQAPVAPIIIVHQTSADNTRQSITGSGACKVSRVAARCGK
jgi:hypothetical protein